MTRYDRQRGIPSATTRRRRVLVLALTMTVCGRLGSVAAAVDPLDGVPQLATSSAHMSYASPDGRPDLSPRTAVEAAIAAGAPRASRANGTGAFVIQPTFDVSITSNPSSAAIQAMINDAIALYSSLFNDRVTASILFRFATTQADGGPLPGGALATSLTTLYQLPWDDYVNALRADAKTANDATANANIPFPRLADTLLVSSANGRAVGANTPPSMFSNGTISTGGPFDGIVTLNAAQVFSLTRPPAPGHYDALRTLEHEVDEVLGLGSGINRGGPHPQDLFSWSSPGVRNVTVFGDRYFSIDGGATAIVGFNQDPAGDLGDWLSGPCPQVRPDVQNAFSCPDQVSDVSDVSAEGVNLDVVGYDLISGSSSQCACRGDVDNFCFYASGTPGCPMTDPGGYCDPNGDGSNADADWVRGFGDFGARCNSGPEPGICQCRDDVDNFCFYASGTADCPMTAPGGYCDPNGDGSNADANWQRGFSEFDAACRQPSGTCECRSDVDNYCFYANAVACGFPYCDPNGDGSNADADWLRGFSDFQANCCTPGTTTSCYTGPSGTLGLGICRAGTQTCSASGSYGACIGETLPQDEVCNNGQDDDCSGGIDDGCTANRCSPNPPLLSILIHNEFDVAINFNLAFAGGPFAPFVVGGHAGVLFTGNADFVINYDRSFDAGYQAQSYALPRNGVYRFGPTSISNDIGFFAEGACFAGR